MSLQVVKCYEDFQMSWVFRSDCLFVLEFLEYHTIDPSVRVF